MANGDPIARGNIELGVDASKLDAGMKEAKKKAEEAVATTEKAANKTTQKAAQNGGDVFGFGAAKAAALALVGAVQRLTLGIKEAMSSGEGLVTTFRAIEDAFRSDTTAGLDPITKRRIEIEKTKDAMLDQLRVQEQQRNILADIVALASGNAEIEAQRVKILQEAEDAQKRLVKSAEEAAKNAAADAAKKANADAEAELRAFGARRRLAIAKAEDDAAIRVEAELRANKIIEDDKRRRAAESIAELGRLQSEQLAQLRNDINALYSSGNLEVGIGRVASLLETLIAKTEGRR